MWQNGESQEGSRYTEFVCGTVSTRATMSLRAGRIYEHEP